MMFGNIRLMVSKIDNLPIGRKITFLIKIGTNVMPLQMRVEFSETATSAAPLFLIILLISVAVAGIKQRSWSYLICYTIFGIYLLFAIDRTFFPIWISGAYADARRQIPVLSEINITPFYFGPYGLEDAVSTQLLNILLTVPFGFGINFIARMRPRSFLWLGPAIGFGIEIIQLVVSLLLGYAYRYIDINDVIMNTLGVLVGYAAFRLFAWFYVFTTHRFRINHEGLAAYFYDVSRRSGNV
jgi:glycopeptide antibiotics resistance protein